MLGNVLIVKTYYKEPGLENLVFFIVFFTFTRGLYLV